MADYLASTPQHPHSEMRYKGIVFRLITQGLFHIFFYRNFPVQAPEFPEHFPNLPKLFPTRGNCFVTPSSGYTFAPVIDYGSFFIYSTKKNEYNDEIL